MNKRSSWFMGAFCGAALAFGLSLGGYAVGADGASPSPIVQKILGAKSKADAEALAAQYEQEAGELQAKAEEHREMAKAYRTGYFGPGGKFDLARHCSNLAKKYEEAAKEDLELAKLQRGSVKK